MWLGGPQCDTAPHPKNLMIKSEEGNMGIMTVPGKTQYIF